MTVDDTGPRSRTVERFLTETANRLVARYDVHRGERLGDLPLAFLAEYRRRDEKYLLTRGARIWGVESRELLLVAAPSDPLDLSFLGKFSETMRVETPRLVEGASDHMTTICLGVAVTDRPVVDIVATEAVNYRKLKFLRFGFHGWVEMYLAVVDLARERVHIHRKGLPFAEILRSGLSRESSRH